MSLQQEVCIAKKLVQIGIFIEDRTLWLESSKKRARQRGMGGVGASWIQSVAKVGHHSCSVKLRLRCWESSSLAHNKKARRPTTVYQNASETGQNPQNWSVKTSQVQNHSRTRHLDGHVAWSVAKSTAMNAWSPANKDREGCVERTGLAEAEHLYGTFWVVELILSTRSCAVSDI